MSDYQELCERYGTTAGDPDFMDWFLDHINSEEVAKTYPPNAIVNGLNKGRLVHMVKLTATRPARPIAAKFHLILPNDVSFTKSNVLTIDTLDEPAGWFVSKGFTVRSMKENGCWYQLAYKSTDQETTLSKALVNEYCSFANLKPEPSDYAKNC
ncbi:hypothetical protein [Vibrio rotiferianus]|uniref:Uncharacterized protein n=1 Tax=Vibrio sp. DAT722 TaxID=344879 RepID=Q2FA03_9VIBR|nr:hypothetical protein [Vibrio rotiferianus]ABA55868.1 hypothetical protein [Vibrio sp. DAT722]